MDIIEAFAAKNRRYQGGGPQPNAAAWEVVG